MDLRDSPRFPVSVPVVCEYDGNVIECETINISRAGMMLMGRNLPPVGTEIKLRINLTYELELECEVRHAVHGCGVRVLSMKPDQENKWNSYLDQLASAVAQSASQIE
jgi:hypothetical protein